MNGNVVTIHRLFFRNARLHTKSPFQFHSNFGYRTYNRTEIKLCNMFTKPSELLICELINKNWKTITDWTFCMHIKSFHLCGLCGSLTLFWAPATVFFFCCPFSIRNALLFLPLKAVLFFCHLYSSFLV